VDNQTAMAAQAGHQFSLPADQKRATPMAKTLKIASRKYRPLSFLFIVFHIQEMVPNLSPSIPKGGQLQLLHWPQ
jgi:hypothetical protein